MAYKGNQTTWHDFAPSLQRKLETMIGENGEVVDLTEINQKIDDLKTEVTEHLAESVVSEDGAHGIRYFNDKLGINNGADWSEIEIGKPNANGVLALSNNHAIRYFNPTTWTNDVNAEKLTFKFPNVVLTGTLIIRTNHAYVPAVTAAGGGVVEIYVQRDKDSGGISQEFNIPNMATQNGKLFNYSPVRVVNNTTPYFTITKKSRNIPLYYELEFLTNNGNPFDILDQITLEIDSTATAPDTTPNQQSNFKQVNDNIAPTPMGLTPNAPFTTEATSKLSVGKVGNVAVLSFAVKNSQQLATSSQYQLCEILPVGYRNLRATVVGHGFCFVSGVARLIPVTITNGIVIMQSPPVAIPANTDIDGNITFYVE
ncbi:hypothetical protein ACIQXF_04675 [Lysinibacillus sp. NPDC097231]|uniref:hypothetical protein n=1 Tax=Lysinibacillus sp. NPDC097231 TaxID=3364142 RepID=UPI00380F5FAE